MGVKGRGFRGKLKQESEEGEEGNKREKERLRDVGTKANQMQRQAGIREERESSKRQEGKQSEGKSERAQERRGKAGPFTSCRGTLLHSARTGGPGILLIQLGMKARMGLRQCHVARHAARCMAVCVCGVWVCVVCGCVVSSGEEVWRTVNILVWLSCMPSELRCAAGEGGKGGARQAPYILPSLSSRMAVTLLTQWLQSSGLWFHSPQLIL